MKKLIFVLFTCTYLTISCSKKENVSPDVSNDVSKEFSESVVINGAVKVAGDIPNPTIGDFGFENEVLKTEIDADPYSGFKIEFNSSKADDGIVFLKFDNSSDYVEIEFENNRIVNYNNQKQMEKLAKAKLPFTLASVPGWGMIKQPSGKALAKLQICKLPKKNGKLDKTKINEKKYWCPPKNITFNCKTFDCNLQKISNEFSNLSSFILSSSFTSSDCEYIKAKYNQLISSLLPCSSISSSDKSTLSNANKEMQSIDCSIFGDTKTKELSFQIAEIMKNL